MNLREATMITVPSFILRRLYVNKSLRKTKSGFEFQLNNKLGSGYARKLLPLTLDDVELPLEQCRFTVNGQQVSFKDVSVENPFTLAMNKKTVIAVNGVNLSGGNHKIGMTFEVAGLGILKFDFNDVAADD